mmetsp:Transcript_43358/g.131897  ORF Transcript_43358/g.131897 Transcript_43358/m.131897 type:complete len:216 (+) Transcript_43358:534-1181(+)|eukprot:CAMPEP_0113578890 /NCGR_PEP_ID=MMETSP0015_2-20120614/29758_1 /TAXON_ID=2838 /ORGANISM="Odontella" /LENGTH=215 /DNA_ID=CAMNT_0000482797 /DNA_START=420 /DNA_END=1067 /DNA_ORIENTATION=+ /assembly_acc=CAM_ASM_000160
MVSSESMASNAPPKPSSRSSGGDFTVSGSRLTLPLSAGRRRLFWSGLRLLPLPLPELVGNLPNSPSDQSIKMRGESPKSMDMDMTTGDLVGSFVGSDTGGTVGDCVGKIEVGETTGDLVVGSGEGTDVGSLVGSIVGRVVGEKVTASHNSGLGSARSVNILQPIPSPSSNGSTSHSLEKITIHRLLNSSPAAFTPSMTNCNAPGRSSALVSTMEV